MSLQFDPEFAKAIEPFIPLFAARPRPAVHDVEARRNASAEFLGALMKSIPQNPDIEVTVHHVEAADGFKIPVYEFRKKGASSSAPTSAVLHVHGGGMFLGSVEMFQPGIALQVDRTSVPFFSVDYRLAPEATGTSLVDDCYTALVWLNQNAKKFNIDPARIGVSGESAGGGIAAGVALKARDEGLQPPLAKQILVYPMLDDRNNVPNEAVEPLAPLWKMDDNITGWTALLGKEKAGIPEADVSEYAAPARAKSLKGLPSTYIDVGTLDIFRDEDILYASRLAAENIDTEFHLYPGIPHAFEVFAPEIKVTLNAIENRLKAVSSF